MLPPRKCRAITSVADYLGVTLNIQWRMLQKLAVCTSACMQKFAGMTATNRFARIARIGLGENTAFVAVESSILLASRVDCLP